MSDYLFCCRSAGELEAVRQEVEQGQYGGVYRLQSNLEREKSGFRCTRCGKYYPFLSIHHHGETIDPKSLSKPIGRLLKCRKASDAFCGNHYYATSKKSLLRFDIDVHGNGTQTEEIPIMGGVCHVALSPDERYIAAETFGGTIAIIDSAAKEIIARKRSCRLNGNYLLDHGNRLLFYQHDAIRCWDFLRDRELILWQVPEDWPRTDDKGNPLPVNCTAVLQLDGQRILFQLYRSCKRYAVILRNLQPDGVFPLADNWVHAQLSYIPELDRYTFPARERVIVYDGQFRMTDVFDCPDIRSCQNGGGMFPITVFADKVLKRAFLSPDGKWVLLDYFNEILLMERESGLLRYCVYSDSGGASCFMGFLDDTHIWYNWGNSTCIMELPGQENT